jgi:hypothetical protein
MVYYMIILLKYEYKLLFLFILTICFISCKPTNTSISSNYKIVATFSPGYSPWKPWETTISSNGDVQQVIYPWLRDENVTKPKIIAFKLSIQDLHDLIAVIEDENFFNLKSKYSRPETDGPTLVIAVSTPGKTHEVSVYFPHLMIGKSEIKRFIKIWDEVLRKVPAPNKGQTPGNIKAIR